MYIYVYMCVDINIHIYIQGSQPVAITKAFFRLLTNPRQSERGFTTCIHTHSPECNTPNPQPHTLHPTPCTLHHQRSKPYPQPSTCIYTPAP